MNSTPIRLHSTLTGARQQMANSNLSASQTMTELIDAVYPKSGPPDSLMKPSASPSSLQIHVHSVTGSVTPYVQDDPETARKLMANFQPSRLFLQEKIIIAGGNSISTFPTSKVARIDFKSEGNSLIHFLAEPIVASELTEPQFQALIRNPVMSKQWYDLSPGNQSVVVFMEVIMASDATILLTMELKIDTMPDINEIRESILGRASLCLRLQNVGVSVINLTNLNRVTLFAGATEMTANALPALLARSEATTGEAFPPVAPKARKRICLQVT